MALVSVVTIQITPGMHCGLHNTLLSNENSEITGIEGQDRKTSVLDTFGV